LDGSGRTEGCGVIDAGVGARYYRT